MNSKRIAVAVVCLLVIIGLGIGLTDNPISEALLGDEPTNTHSNAINTPDADKSVNLENKRNGTQDVRIEVVRDSTGNTVHNQTYSLNNTMDDVYNLQQADPEGVESFTVIATTDKDSGQVSIDTSQCFGNVQVELTEENGVYPFYAVC